MQSEINIKVGNKAPRAYFEVINIQMSDEQQLISGLSGRQQLLDNLNMNCVPVEIEQMTIADYEAFLSMRRKLMAVKIRAYYQAL